MVDKFLKHWFNGFERSLNSLDSYNRENILKECGKSCSDSYTKQIYIDAYKSSKSMDDFINRLQEAFPEISLNIIKENQIYELMYNFCACDLVKNGYVENPLMCECSRQSLLYNWGCVFGQNNVQVQLLQSILSGDSCCKFIVSLQKSDFAV